MAIIDELIQQIKDDKLRDRIQAEADKLMQQKKFGLVFESHLPECTPLYEVPVKVGGTVSLKNGSIDELYLVKDIKEEQVFCVNKKDGTEQAFPLNEVVTTAEFGEPIYPYLQYVDSLSNAPDSELWHTLIEADNYHALQLLEYLYAGKVDCIYIDPACGAGGMFVQSANFVKIHQGRVRDLSVYGQEANPTTWKLAQMNLAIRGIEAYLGETYADTFFNDQHPTLRADFVMANPPFNMSDWGGDKLTEDKRWKYGTPPPGNANFAWLQHMIYHLSPKGKIGMVLANGSLSSQTSSEGTIRENIIKDDLVECIVAMPTQLFYSTGIPVSLWILNKNKKQKGKTLFIDARNMGEMVTRAHRDLKEEEITKIADTYKDFVKGELEEVQGFCSEAPLEEIERVPAKISDKLVR